MLKLSLSEEMPFKTKTDFVVEAIRTAILVGDLYPGTRVTEQQVKDLLKVSSSPIREAFNKLEAEGLLTRNPHVGATVTSMEVENAKELYVIQAHLQGTAVQICVRKLKEEDILDAERIHGEMKRILAEKMDVRRLRVENYKLHMILCGATVYPWLTRIISALWIRFPTHSYWMMPDNPKSSIEYHERILKAVRRRDEILSGSLMRKHLESSMKALYG